MALTQQEELFCYKYVENGRKAKQAAIAAGYPENEASTISRQLLKRQDIRNEIKLWNSPKVIDPPSYWDARVEFTAQP